MFEQKVSNFTGVVKYPPPKRGEHYLLWLGDSKICGSSVNKQLVDLEASPRWVGQKGELSCARAQARTGRPGGHRVS